MRLTIEQRKLVKEKWEKYGPLSSRFIAVKCGLTKEYVDEYVQALNSERYK